MTLAKGDEMGLFKLGSTAIVLFGPNVVAWDSAYKPGTATMVGKQLGRLIGNRDSANGGG
jgi:phosphatidylserine decarboxylase